MTHSLALRTIYLEGEADVAILSRWFPHLQFKQLKGKDQVRSKVEQEPASYGLLDRDFATDNEVEASRGPGSRMVIMRRYAIENYLLEPNIIIAAVSRLMPHTDLDGTKAWLDEGHTQQSIHQWAVELALYAAANSIISEWRNTIELDFLRYFGPLPPLSPAEVIASLQRRLAALTPVDQIEAVLDARYEQVQSDLAEWHGLQRWINGKVLLEKYLYPQVFAPMGLSQARMRDTLIESGREFVPAELQELAQQWEI